jgi:hypothetical protein
MPRPEFIDNRDGRTMQIAIQGYLDHLAGKNARPIDLSIASGYFHPSVFELLATQMEKLAQLSLLATQTDQFWRFR